tara:strand:+ start:1173 stop:2087 length:915 start_codon:yes stop_codon:yes gene_type:complete
LILKGLYENALISPEKLGADELFIVSGYASATFAYRHLRALSNAKINLIIGMPGTRDHLSFQDLIRRYPHRFMAYYIDDSPFIHAKTYAWYQKGKPMIGFSGSANYSQTGFDESKQINQLELTKPSELFSFFFECMERAIPISQYAPDDYGQHILPINSPMNGGMYWEKEGEIVTISFLDRKGELPGRSGLNWGQRPEANREPNQAYLRIPKQAQYEGFLPNKGSTFSLITDDGKSLDCTVQQDSRKAVSTTYDNSELGKYFRKRLGVGLGELVTKQHLLDYGRTDFTLRKLNDETFVLDFSVP